MASSQIAKSHRPAVGESYGSRSPSSVSRTIHQSLEGNILSRDNLFSRNYHLPDINRSAPLRLSYFIPNCLTLEGSRSPYTHLF